MLEKIRGTFFIRLVFSNIDEKIKLEIAKYNKNIQNILNLNILTYREFSGRYIIKRKNEIIEEYNYHYNNLVFRGRYLNEKRNGKGIEYRGETRFECEYLNGKRNGKGKEFFIMDDNLKFEGEYLNGKRWNGIYSNSVFFEDCKIKNGKAYIKKYYNHSFELKFEGEYINGKKNGKGKEYYEDNKIKFEGEYLNGKKWNGKEYDTKNNIAYEIINGKGYIKEYWEKGILKFEGQYLNGERNGKGKEYSYNGNLKYEGEYLNGKKNGKGKEYDNSGNLLFEGDYLYNNKKRGKALLMVI